MSIHKQNSYSASIGSFIEQTANQHIAKPLTNMRSFGAYIEPIVQLFKPTWRYNMISANVVDIRSESENVYTLTLKPDSKWLEFEAGQFVQLTVEKEGSLYTRSFSISSPPSLFRLGRQIELSIRVQDQGIITPWLRENINTDSVVYLTQAMGDFTINNTLIKKSFIAAGSGITPIKSMLLQHTDAAWFSQATLLFYVSNRTELLFRDELDELEYLGLNVKVIYSEESGRISEQHLLNTFEEIAQQEYYVCGPSSMIETTTELLSTQGVSEKQIHFEYFGPAPVSALSDQDLASSTDEDDDETIQVDYLSSQKQVKFNAQTLPKTLLDLAEQEGLKPVSGCRIGVCHQCICKKKQGRVYNTKTKQYSDTGSEEIQLCLSVPVGHVELEL